jgi:hypothetical protein
MHTAHHRLRQHPPTAEAQLRAFEYLADGKRIEQTEGNPNLSTEKEDPRETLPTDDLKQLRAELLPGVPPFLSLGKKPTTG